VGQLPFIHIHTWMHCVYVHTLVEHSTSVHVQSSACIFIVIGKRVSEASETLSGDVQSRIVVCMCVYLVRGTYLFARASNFARGTVSGAILDGLLVCKLQKKKRIIKQLMLWFSIEFSDYGATIVSQLSLRFLNGRSI